MIVLSGKLDRVLTDGNKSIVSFTIPNYQSSYLKELTDELYTIEIKKPKSRKTLAQNDYAWVLIHEIARKNDLYHNPEKVYMDIIKLANIKAFCGRFENNEKCINEFKKIFRVVHIVQERVEVNGVETVWLELYPGMSKFDKDEMQRFIEVLLNYASEVGIDVSGYER